VPAPKKQIGNLPSNYKQTEQKAFKDAAAFKAKQAADRNQQLKINLGKFDAKSYLNRYQDLRDAFGTDEAAARQHYTTYGFNENRDISPFKSSVEAPKIAQNQGPSTPVKMYDGKMMINTGAGRPGDVRLKKPIPKFEASAFSAPSAEASMRDKARTRHDNFKATGVQTFGGTRQNYSLKEAMKIEKALGPGSFSSVTGGAKNPLARPPINPNIKPGEVMPAIQQFNQSLGTDYSSLVESSPKVNYNFDSRDKSNDISFRNAARAGSKLGINRPNNFGSSPKVNYDFDSRDKSRDLNYRDMFQAKDLGNMTTNALTKYVPGLTIRPASMTDRDRQSYLGFNPNNPSRNLKATDPGRPKGQQQGTNSYLAPVNTTAATTAPADEETVKEEEVQPATAEQNLPDTSDISEDEYNATMDALTGGGNNVTSSGQPDVASIAQTTGIDPGIIERILAGYRGKKRIQFGSGRNESLKLRRDSAGFMSRIPQFVLSSLNV
jgi:hypothetical protein